MKTALLSLAFLWLTLTAVRAQTLDPSFTPPASYYANGNIYTVGPAQTDGKRVVAGEFSSISGTATGTVARLDAAGTLDAAFAQNIGIASNVYRIKLLASGKYLLGAQGGPIQAGGVVRNEVMVLNANGTADAAFDAGAGPTSGSSQGYGLDYIAQPDGKVLVAGDFTTYSGTSANSLVRLTATGSVDPTFSVGAGPVHTSGYSYIAAVLVQPTGKILVGGRFTQFGGQATDGLVRLNADGTLDPSFTNPLLPGSYVTGLVAQPDGKVLVSGIFSSYTSVPRLVRLLASGSVDPGFTLSAAASGLATFGLSDPPLALQPDGKIVLLGDFVGTGAPHLLRVNADGTQDLTFQPTVQPSQTPFSVGVQPDGSLLVGVYRTANLFGTTEAPLGRYAATGAFSAVAARVQAVPTVFAVARVADGSLLVGGNFTEWNGQAVHHLVHLSSGGALDAGFSALAGTLVGPVKSLLTQPDGKVLAGTARGPVRLAAGGTPDASFVAHPNITYYPAMALQPDGKLLVGGFPSSPINGVTYNGLVRLTTTGALDPTFVRADGPTLFGRQADAIVIQPDGKILVASDFYPLTGAVLHSVARYTTTGALDASFASPPFLGVPLNTRLFALALQPDGAVLVGGDFDQVGGVARTNVARLTAAGAVDNTFGAPGQLYGRVYALVLQPNNRVLVGGNFLSLNGVNQVIGMARLFSTGLLDNSFVASATPSSTVYSLLVQPNGAVVAGGTFADINGQASQGVARVLASNVLAVAAPTATAARLVAWPVPAHGQLHVAPDLAAQPQSLTLLDALGRPVRQQPWAGAAAEATLTVAGLPAGVYVLRVQYAAGTAARRVVVE
jgi:uncharacterized delta-60 repeat protein